MMDNLLEDMAKAYANLGVTETALREAESAYRDARQKLLVAEAAFNAARDERIKELMNG